MYVQFQYDEVKENRVAIMLHYLLISKDGNVQFSHYFTHSSPSSRPATEARVITKCRGADKDAVSLSSGGYRSTKADKNYWKTLII